MKPIEGYSEGFVARMKDFAVLGLGPVQIAERMMLEGEERRRFLRDVTTHDHPLRTEYLRSKSHGEEDLASALIDSAAGGDAKALKLAYEVEHQRKVDSVKKELFGI